MASEKDKLVQDLIKKAKLKRKTSVSRKTTVRNQSSFRYIKESSTTSTYKFARC
jgi:hypothetical protein